MLVLEFAQAGTNEPIGWYACNLLVKGQLNAERYNVQLLKGDCDKLPINFKNARKGLVKAQFRMLYDEKAESADKEECNVYFDFSDSIESPAKYGSISNWKLNQFGIEETCTSCRC